MGLQIPQRTYYATAANTPTIFDFLSPDYQLQQQKVDQARAFSGGVPTDASGNVDYGAMTSKLFQKGDYADASNLAQLGISQQMMRAAQQPSPLLGGGGSPAPSSYPAPSSSGRGINPEVVSYIRQAAIDRNILPDVALGVTAAEGLRGFDPSGKPNLGDDGSSAGPFQLHYGGVAGGPNASPGLGDEFTKATGLDARDPSTWKRQVDFALDYAAKNGWSPWHGAAKVGIGQFTGIGGRGQQASPVQVAQNGADDSDAPLPSSQHPFAPSSPQFQKGTNATPPKVSSAGAPGGPMQLGPGAAAGSRVPVGPAPNPTNIPGQASPYPGITDQTLGGMLNAGGDGGAGQRDGTGNIVLGGGGGGGAGTTQIPSAPGAPPGGGQSDQGGQPGGTGANSNDLYKTEGFQGGFGGGGGGGGFDLGTNHGAEGGDGGFGGGGGGVSALGSFNFFQADGRGGFGGGGGGGVNSGSDGPGGGGPGGFGGGNGRGPTISNPRYYSFGGGRGSVGSGSDDAGAGGSGGGGAAMGGAVFVSAGGSLTINGSSSQTGSTLTAGTGADGIATSGGTYGAGIFFEGNPDNSTPAVFKFGDGDQSYASQIADLNGAAGGPGRPNGFYSSPVLAQSLSSRILGGTTTVLKSGTGTLTLGSTNTYSGGTTIQNGSINAAAAGALGGGIVSFQSDPGQGQTATLALSLSAQKVGATFGNTLDSLDQTTDRLDLIGFTFDGVTSYAATADGTLTVGGGLGGSQTESFSLTNYAARYTAADDGAGGTLIAAEAPCYCSGTLIRTARGEVAVEKLRVGDLAITATGAPRPITWIGRRDLDAQEGPLDHDERPVCIREGAFGLGLPARDLYLSPGHPVLVGADEDGEGGYLVPIMCLINGTTIERVAVDEVTYWHVELDEHDILLAEGLPAESYIDLGSRPWFAGANGALYDPNFVAPGMPGRCRPVAIDGPIVEAERRRLDQVFATKLASAAAWPIDEDALAL